jgi:hypothetical protein
MENLSIMPFSESEVFSESGSRLNKQQVDMIYLLRNPIPDEHFLELKKKAIELLAKRIDKLTEIWEDENQITKEFYDDLANGHVRFKS